MKNWWTKEVDLSITQKIKWTIFIKSNPKRISFQWLHITINPPLNKNYMSHSFLQITAINIRILLRIMVIYPLLIPILLIQIHHSKIKTNRNACKNSTFIIQVILSNSHNKSNYWKCQQIKKYIFLIILNYLVLLQTHHNISKPIILGKLTSQQTITTNKSLQKRQMTYARYSNKIVSKDGFDIWVKPKLKNSTQLFFIFFSFSLSFARLKLTCTESSKTFTNSFIFVLLMWHTCLSHILWKICKIFLYVSISLFFQIILSRIKTLFKCKLII